LGINSVNLLYIQSHMDHTYLLLNAAPSAPNTKEKSMSQNISYDPSPSDYQKIEARARALQGEATLHLFRASARALSRAFRH